MPQQFTTYVYSETDLAGSKYSVRRRHLSLRESLWLGANSLLTRAGVTARCVNIAPWPSVCFSFTERGDPLLTHIPTAWMLKPKLWKRPSCLSQAYPHNAAALQRFCCKTSDAAWVKKKNKKQKTIFFFLFLQVWCHGLVIIPKYRSLPPAINFWNLIKGGLINLYLFKSSTRSANFFCSLSSVSPGIFFFFVWWGAAALRKRHSFCVNIWTESGALPFESCLFIYPSFVSVDVCGFYVSLPAIFYHRRWNQKMPRVVTTTRKGCFHTEGLNRP